MPIRAEDAHAAFQRGKLLASGGNGGRIVGHQPLVAAVQRGFDHLHVLDIHLHHVGQQAANERELLLALLQHRLDALGHAFATALQVLQHLLPRDQRRAMLAGVAHLPA